MIKMAKQKYVVLQVVDGEDGFMETYSPQVAMVHEYESMEDAATFNVGSHPDAAERGKPYRTVVIPWEHWHVFDVYSNRIRGRNQFEALPTKNPPITPLDD
jgi:hypothetical protein